MIKHIVLPVHVVSESNMREHWRKAHIRHKAQKACVKWFMLSSRIPTDLPCKITMTRLSSRNLDSDNLQTAFKYIRDAVSEHFITNKAPGRADDDPRFEWHYSQEKSSEKAVRLTFEWPDQQ